MSAFDGLVRVWGTITPAIQAHAAKDIERRVNELLTEAMLRWESVDWLRFDNEESNCTVRLFKFADDACRDTAVYRLLNVVLEWHQPTREMLEGHESAAAMKRPDLRVSIGGSAAVTIECKRLDHSAQLPKRYVDDGIARFVGGSYAAGEDAAFMIGYHQAGELPAAIDAVNTNVTAHPSMNADHCLDWGPPIHARIALLRSNHPRAGMPELKLTHIVPDLR